MSARGVLVLLAAAAALLLGVELALGARHYGEVRLEASCSPHAVVARGGLDGTVQRIVVKALDEASCRLGTTRERLLLSLSPSGGSRFRTWTDADVERALRSALVSAIDDAERRGDLNGVEARILRALAERAPVQLVVEIATHIGDLSALGGLFP